MWGADILSASARSVLSALVKNNEERSTMPRSSLFVLSVQADKMSALR